ncbi:hypothetical protein [Crossiella sp. CA198]
MSTQAWVMAVAAVVVTTAFLVAWFRRGRWSSDDRQDPKDWR